MPLKPIVCSRTTTICRSSLVILDPLNHHPTIFIFFVFCNFNLVNIIMLILFLETVFRVVFVSPVSFRVLCFSLVFVSLVSLRALFLFLVLLRVVFFHIGLVGYY